MYEDFESVTRKSLVHAAAEAGCPLADEAVDALMETYHALPRSVPFFAPHPHQTRPENRNGLTRGNHRAVTQTPRPPGRRSPRRQI
jgi:hypothetical protein